MLPSVLVFGQVGVWVLRWRAQVGDSAQMQRQVGKWVGTGEWDESRRWGLGRQLIA